MNFYLNIQCSDSELPRINFEKAILSFKKYVERTSVKVKQISDIYTKVNSCKNYCVFIGIAGLYEFILNLKSGFLKSMGVTWFRRVCTVFWLHVEDFWLPPKSTGNNLKCRLRLRCCRLIDGSYLLTGVSTAG